MAGLHIWPVGQVVKTPPFHGGNTSSSLVRVTRKGAPLCGAPFLAAWPAAIQAIYTDRRLTRERGAAIIKAGGRLRQAVSPYVESRNDRYRGLGGGHFLLHIWRTRDAKLISIMV